MSNVYLKYEFVASVFLWAHASHLSWGLPPPLCKSVGSLAWAILSLPPPPRCKCKLIIILPLAIAPTYVCTCM